MSRQCQCGGVIRSHQLTKNREAWSCKDCGRYEVVQREEKTADPTPEQTDEQKGGSL